MKYTLLSFMAFGTLLASAQTNKIGRLPEMIVYASRIENSASSIPSSINVFSIDDIRQSHAKDVNDFLSKKANVHIRNMNANPVQSQIAMKGFGENSFGRVKIVADGRTLNNVDMSPPMLTTEALESIERIEVIHGPSPVLYGDGAIAGVINLRSSTEDYEKKTKISGRAGSQYTYGGNFLTKGGFAEDGIMYRASYDYLQSDGYRKRSAYDTHSFNSMIRKNFENDSTIGLKVNYQNIFYEMPGALDYASWKNGRKSAAYENDWGRIWSYGVALDSKFFLSDDEYILFDASFVHKFRKANWGDYNYANEYNLYEIFLSPRYINEKQIFDFDNKLTVGIDYRHDLYRVLDNSGFGAPKPYFNRDRIAAFAQDEFFVTDEFSLMAGGRIETINNRWTKTTSVKNNNYNDFIGSYEFGAVYRPVEDFRTWMKTTRFFRSAFCDEMSYTENGEMLDPETGYSVDLGGEYAFIKEFTFDANFYALFMNDEIFYNPYTTYYGSYWGGYNCNSPSKTQRLGMDTGLSWKKEKTAEASIKYNIVHASFTEGQYNSKNIPMVPSHRIRLEVGYWIIDDIEVKCGYSFISSQHLGSDFKNEHGKLPSYSLFDAGIFYTPYWAEGWTLSATIDNIFDRKYCDYASWSDYLGPSYYPACGRSFMFTLSYEF